MRTFKTNDYHRFHFLDGNREVNKNHVKNLIDSISRRNLLETNPIIVNEKMEIIDGQHRLAAAMALDIPIFYVLQDKTDLTDVQRLNATVKKWSLMDFANSYANLGNQNYIILKDFCQTYNVPISIAVVLLDSRYGGTSKDVVDAFKNGEFVADQIAYAKKIGEMLGDYKPYVDQGAWRSGMFIRSIIHLNDEKLITHDRMLHKLKTFGNKLQRQSTVTDYLRELERIYNFKSKGGKIRFF